MCFTKRASTGVWFPFVNDVLNLSTDSSFFTSRGRLSHIFGTNTLMLWILYFMLLTWGITKSVWFLQLYCHCSLIGRIYCIISGEVVLYTLNMVSYFLREYIFMVTQKLFASRRDQVIRKRNSTRIRIQIFFKENMKILTV